MESELWTAAGRQRLQEFDSLFMSSACRAERISIADRLLSESAHLHSLVAEFITRRNAYASPLLSLPTEILAQIVDEVARSESSPWPSVSPKDLAWIKLGHVCSRLRGVLLRLHELWADAVCFLPRAHQELLRRAGSTPLSIVLRSSLRPSEDTINFSVKHLDLARRIATNDANAFEAMLPSLLCEELPFLEDVYVELWSDGFSPLPGLRPEAYARRPVIAPRLRSLTMINAFVPFNASTLHTLRIIENGPPPDDEMLPSSEQFLAMLRACTCLETLHLDGFIPALPFLADMQSSCRVYLPSMVSLSLYGSRDRVIALWSNITVPRSARVHVCLDWCPDARIDFDARVLAPHLSGAPTGVKFAVPLPGVIAATAFYDDGESPLPCLHCDSGGAACAEHHRALTLQYQHFRGSAAVFSSAVVSAFGLAQASTVHLSFVDDGSFWREDDTRAWRAALQLFPVAHSVCFTHAPPALYEVLRAEKGPVLLSALQTLTSHYAEIAGGRQWTEWAGGRARLIKADLMSMLKSRALRGVPVHEVRFRDLRLPVGYEQDAFIAEVQDAVFGTVSCTLVR
ncbi:hypothetical protein PENSPDRAFT_740336 [Peniophora sp. CONT]|nr:hypothetical protein PENSPDRAFT_740336 [Peniophora sp. CONT]